MYEQQIAFINKRIAELSEKAQLEKTPRLKRSRRAALASADILRNRLLISENLLEQWQKGDFDEEDIKAMLAHEFGHFIGYHRKSRIAVFKHFLVIPVYMILLLVPPLIGLGLSFPRFTLSSVMIVPILSFSFLIWMLIWILFLPWMIRRNRIPDELEADRNAVAFSLIEAQELANSIVKRIGVPLRKDWVQWE